MTSYRQILKSTSVIGGSSLVAMAIRMVRTKFVAVLLGPAGVGLMGLYLAVTAMVGTVSAMGIGTSGVRQIAEAHGTGDEDRLARTVKALRRTVWITGFLGMAFMILASPFLSTISFGSPDHFSAMAILGVTILLANITSGQACLLQGTRRINDLARAGIIGTINGTVISIPCYYFWGQKGIVPSLILISGATLITSWWYARRVSINRLAMTRREIREVAIAVLRSGAPFMLAALLIALSGYIVRVLLIRQFGLEGAGIWQAAFILSSVLVNFLLSAMGTDYYPRLSAMAHDDQGINESVNTQTEIAMLLAVPGLMASIIFAPLVITIFYSGRFDASADILRWSVYGVFARVISWPLEFIMLARGMGKTYFCSEIFSNLFYVAAIWYCIKWWDLTGTGVAFMLMYFVYAMVVYAIGHTVAGVSWSRINLAHITVFGALLVTAGVISAFVDSPWYQYAINLALLTGTGGYCLHRLSRKSGIGFHAISEKAGNRISKIMERVNGRDNQP